MPISSVNGISSPAGTARWSVTDEWRCGLDAPSARVAASGNRPALIRRVRLYLGGYGAARTGRYYVAASNGSGKVSASSTVSIPSGNATLRAYATLADNGYLVANASGGARALRIGVDTNGSVYVGWGNDSGNTLVDVGGGGGWSGQSLVGNIDWRQVPSAPGTFTADDVGASSADLSWVVPTDDGDEAITGYRIEVATNPGFTGATIVDVDSPVEAATLTGLTPATLYYVRVAAMNLVATAAGTSGPWSATVTFTTLGGVPTGLAVTASTSVQLTAEWTAPTISADDVIVGYELDYSTSPGFTGATRVSEAGTSRTISGLQPGATYYLRVRTVFASGGRSAWSSTVSHLLPSGGNVRDLGEWRPGILRVVRDSGVVAGEFNIRDDGAWKPAS